MQCDAIRNSKDNSSARGQERAGTGVQYATSIGQRKFSIESDVQGSDSIPPPRQARDGPSPSAPFFPALSVYALLSCSQVRALSCGWHDMVLRELRKVVNTEGLSGQVTTYLVRKNHRNVLSCC